MNRIMLIVVVLASALWLSGCMVISAEEHKVHGHSRVMSPPPVERVEVIHVPGPGPRSHHPAPRPHGWR